MTYRGSVRALLLTTLLIGCARNPVGRSTDGAPTPATTASASPTPLDAGASSVEPPPPPNLPNATSAEAYRKEVLALACARDVRCGTIAASERAACEQGAFQSPVVKDAIELANRGQFTIDLSRTGECLAIWKSLPCHADRFVGPPGCVHGVADVTMRAAVPPGKPCTRDEVCEGGYCPAPPACTSKCVAYAKTGEACDSDKLCEPSAYCWDGTCRVRQKEGEACPGHWQACADGLWCKGYRRAQTRGPRPMPASPGVCSRPRAEGEGCATDENEHHCRADLFCDGVDAEPRCRPRLPRGAECGWLDACADGLACAGLTLGGGDAHGRRYGVTARGRCEPWSDAGGACDPAAYVSGCPAAMRCDPATRTCKSTGRLGDACESSWVPPGTPDDKPITRRGCTNALYCNPATLKCERQSFAGKACTPTRFGVDDEPCWLSRCDPATRRCTPQCK